jgi:cytochrome c oxidase assembly factor CtaG
MVLFKGNRRGLLADMVPSGQSVPDSCPACGAWRSQLAQGLCCTTTGCQHAGQLMPSQLEGPVALTPLLQRADQVQAEVKRLSKREGRLSFDDEQELRESRAYLEGLQRTIRWLRKHGS